MELSTWVELRVWAEQKLFPLRLLNLMLDYQGEKSSGIKAKRIESFCHFVTTNSQFIFVDTQFSWKFPPPLDGVHNSELLTRWGKRCENFLTLPYRKYTQYNEIAQVAVEQYTTVGPWGKEVDMRNGKRIFT